MVDVIFEPYHGTLCMFTGVFDHALSRFSINVPTTLSIRFVHVKKLQQGPRSMIGQSIDSMKLAYRSLIVATPDIFFDTTGCAFTFIIAKIVAGCKVAAYVHYPTISTDMLQLVWERRPTYNNDNAIVASPLKSYLKVLYYVCFAVCYGLVGSLSDLVLTNSTWTCNHIRSLWMMAKSIIIIFPPCDTKSLLNLPIQNRQKYIMSIGQFRPEKDHMLQMKAFSLLAKNNNFKDVKLLLIGSCRGSGDESRVQELKALSKSLGIEDRVEFVVNQPFSVLKKWFGIASVGLHTMWNEHFGIGVVEMMAAGLITIAHNSGGPRSDIILSGETGYLASTAEEYANVMKAVFSQDKNDVQFLQMREKGRASAQRFSDDVFATSLEKILLESNILQRY